MARIRQQFPQNYGSSSNISTEFENLVRYLNAAEKGNRTLGEMLDVLFSEDGTFDGPIEFQRSTSGDIEYRVGEYSDPAAGWTILLTAAETRGEPGSNVGSVGQSIFASRHDVIATASQTVVPYAFGTEDQLQVFVDGVLQREGLSYDYTKDAAADTVTFTSGRTAGETITILKVRTDEINNYSRTDFVSAASQAVFAYVHTAESVLSVYLNGILQRPGGSYDYTTNPDTDTITFTSALTADNTVSVIETKDPTLTAVSGLMLEGNFVDPATGLILLSKIGIPAGGIAQTAIADLTTALSSKAKLTVSASSPVDPTTGDFWLDTSQTPHQMKYYDGADWLRTSPETALPSFSASNANQILKVNGTGTALEFGAQDLSSAVLKTQMGAATGVATLDASARLPYAQLPEALSSQSIFLTVASPTNQTYDITRIYKQTLRIDAIAVRTASGTCDVQVSVNGTTYGAVHSASATPVEVSLGSPIEIDATASSAMIQVAITAASTAADLEVVLACVVLTT